MFRSISVRPPQVQAGPDRIGNGQVGAGSGQVGLGWVGAGLRISMGVYISRTKVCIGRAYAYA